MVHPIFSVLISRPELVVDHVAGYASLVHQEASSIGAHVARRAVAWGVAVLAFTIFLVLAGAAVMLGVMYGEFHWVLVAVPCIALVLSALAVGLARQSVPGKAFVELKAQLEADAQALRAARAKS
ncbi:MAG: hypothetical protein HYX47_20730 [Burkholderiales bacterium]|nr:hypothetical protein [Burkholderiales bacterium]